MRNVLEELQRKWRLWKLTPQWKQLIRSYSQCYNSRWLFE
jgi:hypothetical protein